MELLQQRMKERTMSTGGGSSPGSPTFARKQNRSSRQLSPGVPRVGSVIVQNGELPTDRRALVVEEILMTEENYIDDLRLCIDYYLFPLRNSAHLMKPADVTHVFSNMEFLYFIHCEIYHKISESVNKEDKVATLEEMVTSISKVFIQYADRLVAVYGQYCVDHMQALDLLQKCITTTPALKTWLDTQVEKMTQGLYLRDFLVKPIQRICKYPLLFRELTKLTAEGSQDLEDLQQTQSTFEEIAGRVNTNKAAQENKKKIEEIEGAMDDYNKPVTSFGRVFHKEGDLMKYNKKLKGQVRYCFLFNDMLIYTQKKGARYQFKGEIPLNGSLVSDINAKGEAGTKLASMGKDVNVGFQITHLEAKRIYYFFPGSEAEKKDWVQRVEVLTQQAFEAEKKRRETSPDSGSGGISPIGRFWKGRRETNVTLNSITAKYGAMSPASAERNAVPIKPVSPSSRSNGADENGSGEERPATGLASRTSGLKQRPYSMQVSEVSSSGSEVQQMMKAIDTMVGLEKLERAKLGERIRDLERKWSESQQAHDEKVEQMTKVISEQEERYKRLEETLLKIVADNEQQRAEAKRAEEFEALKQQLEEVQAKVGTLADEVTAAKTTEEQTPAPTTTTTTTPTSQPVDNNSETNEKEEKEVKEKDTTTVAEKNEDKKKKMAEEKEEEKEPIKPKDVTDDASSPAKKEKQPTTAATASPSTPKKKTAKAKTSTAATPPTSGGDGDEPDLGVFSPRKGLSKGKDSSGSRFGGLFGGGKKASASTDSAEKEKVDDAAKDKKAKKTKDDSKTKGKEKKKEKEKAPKKKTTPAQSKP